MSNLDVYRLVLEACNCKKVGQKFAIQEHVFFVAILAAGRLGLKPWQCSKHIWWNASVSSLL